MTVSEFKYHIGKYLDKVVAGELITFERGGVTFTITANVIPKIREK